MKTLKLKKSIKRNLRYLIAIIFLGLSVLDFTALALDTCTILDLIIASMYAGIAGMLLNNELFN